MKKIFSVILLMAILMAQTIGITANDAIEVYVNGRFLGADQTAIISEGRTLAPLRAVSEALKCEVFWDDSTKTAQIKNEVTIIAVQINNGILTKVDRENPQNIRYMTMDVPPIIHEGRTMIPLRAISEALYAQVEWNGEKRRVDITLEFDYIGDFNEHKIAEVRKNGKYGFINIKREVIVPVIYDDIWRFSEGYAGVKKDGKEGFVNTSGDVVVPIVYDSVMYFHGGAAKIKLGKKWGYVSGNGDAIVPAVYDGGNEFSEGMAAVKNGEKWGCVNFSGELVVPIIYDEISDFHDGVAKVKRNNKWGYIDTEGNIKIPIIYDELGDFTEGLAKACINGNWIVIDKSGNIAG